MVLDRAEWLARRKEIYEELYPEAARPKGGRRPKNAEIISPFSEDAAKKTGKTPRTIRQEVQIAEKLAPEVKEMIRGTPVANSKTELYPGHLGGVCPPAG